MLLQDRHARDVRKRLRHQSVGLVELAWTGAEQVERAQHEARRAHRDGVHRGEAGVERGGYEPGPSRSRPVQVGDRNGLAGGIALDAGALVGLQLEELQFAGLLGGGGQHVAAG